MNAVCEDCGHIDYDGEEMEITNDSDCPICGGRLGYPL